MPPVGELSFAKLLGSLPTAQLWAVGIALACSYVAVATLAFHLGQLIGVLGR
jgi:hypothetical protein